MQIARMHSPLQTAGKQALLDRLGRIGRDDAGLHADLAEHRHRGDIAALGDLLEHQRGIEHRELGTAIGLRHRHAEHADVGQAADVLPRKRAVHIGEPARLELALGELAHGSDDLLLLVGQLEAKRFRHRWAPGYAKTIAD